MDNYGKYDKIITEYLPVEEPAIQIISSIIENSNKWKYIHIIKLNYLGNIKRRI